jgi:hypothetical protein
MSVELDFRVHDLAGNIRKLEPISQRFSLAEVKAGKNFNRRNTGRISRIEI